MLVKKLAKTNIFYSLRQKSTTNPKALNSEITQVEARLHKLESGTLDIQNQYKELKSESEVTQLQSALHKLKSDTLDTWNQLDAIEKRIETLEFKIAWKYLENYERSMGNGEKE